MSVGYLVAPNFRENIENHVNVNFCNKNVMITHGQPTPTAELRTTVNFCEKNFCDWMSNHKIYENIVQRKFGAMQCIECILKMSTFELLIAVIFKSYVPGYINKLP